MKNFCLLNERDYGIVEFKNFEDSFEELKKVSKNFYKVVFNLGKIDVDPRFLSYMLKIFRYSISNNFELFYIIENQDMINDSSFVDSKRYFKIFNSIEEYNELKTFAGFEIKIYDDNKYVRNILKDELIKFRFSIKERNSLNFLKKDHESKSNSIYIVDFETYRDEKIEEIKKIKKKNTDSIVILIAFEEGLEEALSSIKYGVNAVIKRPFDVKEFVGTIKSMAISSNLKRENERLVTEVFKREKEIRRLYNEVNEELQLAGDIQKSLLPPRNLSFKNYNIEYIFLPSMNIGGDFCDFVEIDENKFAVIFADISGHGIPAALLSSMLKVFIYNNAIKTRNIPKLMEKLNEEIINIFPKGKFVSMFFLIIDTKTNIMRFCKASQEPALIYRKNEDVVEELETEGQILGLFSKEVFGDIVFEEKSIDFNDGDKLLLYTDGITEETSPSGEYFGVDRLKMHVKEADLEKIKKSLHEFVQKESFSDDLTLLKIERNDN